MKNFYTTQVHVHVHTYTIGVSETVLIKEVHGFIFRGVLYVRMYQGWIFKKGFCAIVIFPLLVRTCVVVL